MDEKRLPVEVAVVVRFQDIIYPDSAGARRALVNCVA
jgi:hypothetical protein